MCGHPSVDVVPEDQAIPREMWVRWDGLRGQRQTAQPLQPASVSTSQTTMATDYDSECTVEYDLESYMNMDYDEDNNTSNNRSTNIPADINDIIAEVTPVAWLDNPLPRPQHVVTDNYSPTCPGYNPDHSPIQIDSDEEEEESRASMSPAPLDIPIVTPANDIFDTDNSDSDLDFEGGG